jgi:hypothetical protein
MLVSFCPAFAKSLAWQVGILDLRGIFLIYPESGISPRRRFYEPEASIRHLYASSSVISTLSTRRFEAKLSY